jgi:acyl carrier protein
MIRSSAVENDIETMSDRITRILVQHAQSAIPVGQISPRLSIRNELGVDSLSLVSVLVELGAELNIDITESGVELSRIETVGDLIGIGDHLLATAAGAERIAPATSSASHDR